jgi:hypothetical protein
MKGESFSFASWAVLRWLSPLLPAAAGEKYCERPRGQIDRHSWGVAEVIQ